MLQSLSIRNFAIIDRLDIEFGPGLNVLTGETGAGKSIIMGALNVLLGGRAGAESVRAGADRASIDAVFDLTGAAEISRYLNEAGIDVEDDVLLLTREITSAGKSSVKIAGRPSTVAQLREVGDWLVDLHGQHEHQSLLAVNRHIDILDSWGGRDVIELRDAAARAHRALRELITERTSLQSDARERQHLIDLYEFQVKEITDAHLVPGEDEDQESDARRLASAQKLAEASASAVGILNGNNENGILDTLALALKDLEEAVVLDEKLTPMVEALKSARYEMEDAARELSAYQEDVEFNPEKLEEIEDRLDLLRTLKRKYGATIEEVIQYGYDTAEKLDMLSNSEERSAELNTAIKQAVDSQNEICSLLTDFRMKIARQFADAVMAELADLAMERTRFEAQITPCEASAQGADQVEFQISTNPGEPMRPLAKIASGGEISRIMLAIKSAMARQEPLPTMVFDEIDAGVGGRTASIIAEKLSKLACNAQILCITHLAQIAGRGDSHYYIEKSISQERTVSRLRLLSVSERVDEIARMIGGAEITETVRKHAQEMLLPGTQQ